MTTGILIWARHTALRSPRSNPSRFPGQMHRRCPHKLQLVPHEPKSCRVVSGPILGRLDRKLRSSHKVAPQWAQGFSEDGGHGWVNSCGIKQPAVNLCGVWSCR